MAKVRFIGTSPTGIGTYEIANKNGLRLELLTYGARLHKLFVPTKTGAFIDVLAGFDDAEGYRKENPYFNAVIGRVVNRIGNARFTLNGKTYSLYQNEGKNCLHGGKQGFESRMFSAEVPDENGDEVVLTYVSPDGEENFPGTMRVVVRYRLTDKNELVIGYEATTDEDTLCNLTNHAYFNIEGDFSSSLDTEVFIRSHEMTESDGELIATGNVLDVTGTAFDFSSPKTIGRDIKEKNTLFAHARGGYDFNYVLEKDTDLQTPAATAYSRKTGIKLTVYTDRPCLQFYTGNFLDGSIVGKKGFAYPYQATFCMETQGYPNACNVTSFPSIVLKKDDVFRSKTVFRFDVE